MNRNIDVQEILARLGVQTILLERMEAELAQAQETIESLRPKTPAKGPSEFPDTIPMNT